MVISSSLILIHEHVTLVHPQSASWGRQCVWPYYTAVCTDPVSTLQGVSSLSPCPRVRDHNPIFNHPIGSLEHTDLSHSHPVGSRKQSYHFSHPVGSWQDTEHLNHPVGSRKQSYHFSHPVGSWQVHWTFKSPCGFLKADSFFQSPCGFQKVYWLFISVLESHVLGLHLVPRLP